MSGTTPTVGPLEKLATNQELVIVNIDQAKDKPKINSILST